MTATGLPVVRTARADDLEALLALARIGGSGLTNLPADAAALQAKLTASAAALASPAGRNGGAAILLITEVDGVVAGTGCIFARVGADWPFYSYRLTRQTSVSRAIGRSKVQTLLNLVNDFDGETEVGGLFVDPAFRGTGVGNLTARARYLFIATHRDWFAQRVIAELRGFQDDAGRSPVWEALGRHFYDMDFTEADRTGAISGNQFIADLGPRYPIYRSLLAPDAQAALGRPHDDGRGAYDMLIGEGFRADDYVDIFDGGPTLVADIDAVRTVRQTQRARVVAIGSAAVGASGRTLVANGNGVEFRAALASIGAVDTDTVAVGAALAQALHLRVGDTLSYAAT